MLPRAGKFGCSFARAEKIVLFVSQIHTISHDVSSYSYSVSVCVPSHAVVYHITQPAH